MLIATGGAQQGVSGGSEVRTKACPFATRSAEWLADPCCNEDVTRTQCCLERDVPIDRVLLGKPRPGALSSCVSSERASTVMDTSKRVSSSAAAVGQRAGIGGPADGRVDAADAAQPVQSSARFTT